MKTNATTSLNDAVRRISEGNVGAASVMALLLKAHPDKALAWIREMDRMEMYGQDIWTMYASLCGQDLSAFLRAMTDGTIAKGISSLKSQRGSR